MIVGCCVAKCKKELNNKKDEQQQQHVVVFENVGWGIIANISGGWNG